MHLHSNVTRPATLALASLLVLGTADPAAAQICAHAPPALALPSQPSDAPDRLWALVEIPAGSAVKYELDAGTGRMMVDRFLSMSMMYPANYGILPCTLAGDGDALDVLVLTREPVSAGALIQVRPIGLLRMVDGGDPDDKVLAVPLESVDPSYADLHSLDDANATELARIEEFFRTYKRLPLPAGEVLVGPWEGVDAARRAIDEALSAAAGSPEPR
jgi:inorganic pyrophosphatase